MKRGIKKLREAVRSIWPPISLYLEEFMNEKNIACTEKKGDPFSEKSWVEEDGCYLHKIACKKNGSYPRVEIEVRIFPERVVGYGPENHEQVIE